MNLLSPPNRAEAMRCLTVADTSCPSYRLAVKERPKYLLLRLLGERGLYRLGHKIYLERSRVVQDPFQEAALRILVWQNGIEELEAPGKIVYCEEYSGKRFYFIHGHGDEKADAIIAGRSEKWKTDLMTLLPSKPLIVIDLGLVHRHHPKELTSLRKQVAASLGVIRRYLWDANMVLASLKRGVYEWLRGLMGRAAVRYTALPGDEAASIYGSRRIILLDPQADKPLTPKDVLEADAFIVGGIVDKIPRPGETSRLPLRGCHEPRRILFHGDVHGVPNRLNMIIEIILRARYVYCGDLDRAISSVMSKRDARLRLMVELSRWSRGKKGKVPLSLYYELKGWLPITINDFVKVARKLGLEVERDVKS